VHLSQTVLRVFGLCTNGALNVYRSDKLRWIYALTPNRRTRFLSTSTHQPGTALTVCMPALPMSLGAMPWVY